MLWPTAVPLTNTAKHESTPSKRTRVDPPESQPRGSAKRLRYSPVGLRSGTRGGSSGKGDRKSTRLNSSHGYISDAGFCLDKKTSRHSSWSRAWRHARGFSSERRADLQETNCHLSCSCRR